MFLPYAIEDDFEYHGRPLLVYFFCIVYAVAHVALYHFMSEFQRDDIFYRFGCVPREFNWWTTFTCTFLHGGYLHLIGNLYFFWIYGCTCERYLGTVKFLILYLVGAFASVFAHVICVPEFYSDIPTIGASGAISAVLGAFLVLFPKVNIRFLVFSVVFARPLPAQAPAYFVLGGWFIVQLAYGLQIIGGSMEVAFWAHIAGFAAGAFVGSIYLYLHNSCTEKDEEIAHPLVGAWHSYLDSDEAGCRTYLAGCTKDKDKYLPENWRMINGILSELVDKDLKSSTELIIKELESRRDRGDYTGVLQCYMWLAGHNAPGTLPAWLHRDGATAAARLKFYKIALYGFYQALLLSKDDSAIMLIKSVKTVLERLGFNEKAEELEDTIKGKHI